MMLISRMNWHQGAGAGSNVAHALDPKEPSGYLAIGASTIRKPTSLQRLDGL